MSNPPPGFVMPPQPPGYPSYPNYPNQPQPNYAHQPFPTPIIQQPGQQPSQFHGIDFDSYLRNVSSLHVAQKVEWLEAIVGWEQGNKYTVKDQTGAKLFYVQEESNPCTRQLCGRFRAFTLRVKDRNGIDIMQMERGCNCTFCCGWCLPDSMTVNGANGAPIGSVRETCSLFQPTLEIVNPAGYTALRIEGPWCPTAFACGPVSFKVMLPDNTVVGTISKEWGGLARELFTDADFFSMSFPPNLDSSLKATCLGALFLIDFEYFESGYSQRQGGRRLFG